VFTARYELGPYIKQLFYNRGGELFKARYELGPYIKQVFIT
jgi:hypothetical protein